MIKINDKFSEDGNWEADLINYKGESLLVITGLLGDEGDFQTAVFREDLQTGLCYNSEPYRDYKEAHYFHKLIADDVRKNSWAYRPKGVEIEMRDFYSEISRLSKSVSRL